MCKDSKRPLFPKQGSSVLPPPTAMGLRALHAFHTLLLRRCIRTNFFALFIVADCRMNDMLRCLAFRRFFFDFYYRFRKYCILCVFCVIYLLAFRAVSVSCVYTPCGFN